MSRTAPRSRFTVAIAATAAIAAAAAIPLADEPGRDPVSGHVPAEQPLILPDGDRQRVNDVAELLICYCGCARQTVRDCTCGIADGIKKGIWSDLTAGKDSSAIVAAYVGAHGPEFRSMPDARAPLGALAFALPYIALGLAILVILPVVARWTRRSGPPPAPRHAPPGGAPADDYATRVDRELSELE